VFLFCQCLFYYEFYYNLDQLLGDDILGYILSNFIEHPNYKPLGIFPWNIEMVNAPSFWNITKGGGRVVAVIDTGCLVTHPELSGKIINPHNLVDFGTDVTDYNGHGTHVSGTIAGNTVGIAPEARIMPLKVANPDGSLNGNAINEAFKLIIDWNKTCLLEDRVVAINCSFGSGFYDSIMGYMIRTLTSDGVVVCVAGGNSGDGRSDTNEIFSFPAFINEVVTVGSINQDGNIANYSNSFDGIDLAAPGTYIYSIWCDGGYKTISGTSMATPHITGACALLADRIYKREGRMPLLGEIDGIADNLTQANGTLFKHIKKSTLHPNFIGLGILDLTYGNKRFSLYHNQSGAYFNQSGSITFSNDLTSKGIPNFIVKY